MPLNSINKEQNYMAFPRDYTENELLDLELKYKQNHEVLELIQTVKQSLGIPPASSALIYGKQRRWQMHVHKPRPIGFVWQVTITKSKSNSTIIDEKDIIERVKYATRDAAWRGYHQIKKQLGKGY